MGLWDWVSDAISKIGSWAHTVLFCILQLHGTYRQKDRIYSEEIFYGKGKALDEVSADVLEKDLAERRSENPQAYRGNINSNELTESDIRFLK